MDLTIPSHSGLYRSICLLQGSNDASFLTAKADRLENLQLFVKQFFTQFLLTISKVCLLH